MLFLKICLHELLITHCNTTVNLNNPISWKSKGNNPYKVHLGGQDGDLAMDIAKQLTNVRVMLEGEASATSVSALYVG